MEDHFERIERSVSPDVHPYQRRSPFSPRHPLALSNPQLRRESRRILAMPGMRMMESPLEIRAKPRRTAHCPARIVHPAASHPLSTSSFDMGLPVSSLRGSERASLELATQSAGVRAEYLRRSQDLAAENLRRGDGLREAAFRKSPDFSDGKTCGPKIQS